MRHCDSNRFALNLSLIFESFSLNIIEIIECRPICKCLYSDLGDCIGIHSCYMELCILLSNRLSFYLILIKL